MNREAKSSYMMTVTATDRYGASDSVDVTIMVRNVDEAPEIEGDDIRKDYEENDTDSVVNFTATDPEGQMIYWSLLASDASPAPEGITPGTDSANVGDFRISSSGVLSFKLPPNYDTDTAANNTKRVAVVASDDAPGAGGTNMSYKKVVVRVTDVDEPGSITLSAQQPQTGVQLTATLTDQDGTEDVKLRWYHSSSSAPSGGTEIDAARDSQTYSPAGTVEGEYLRVTATYTDDFGSEKTATAVSAQRVRAAPSTNAAPATGTATRSLDENSPAGTAVGSPVTTTDPNEDILTYSLGGTNADNFSINRGTGQITVKAGASLNHETNESQDVIVTATDPSGEDGTITVTINIKDVNESPRLTAGPTRIPKMENSGMAVTTYAATDPESADADDACTVASCTWSLGGDDAGDFKISNDAATFGVLTLKADPNYESPADANSDNVYMVNVVAHRRCEHRNAEPSSQRGQ